MKVNKWIAIIIFFTIILNIVMPTVTLAVNEIEGKIEDNITMEETKEEVDEKENVDNKEDNTIGEEKNEDNTQNEVVDKEENNVDKNNNNIIDKDINEEKNTVENVEEDTEEIKSTTQQLMTTMSTNSETALSVSYRTHVEKEGWQNYVQNGEVAGTSGKSLRLEAINIQLLNNTDENLNIKYQVHVQDIGWQDWKQNGEMAGTSGKSLRLEAIRIYLDSSEDYSIMYRVHIQDIGWQDWKTDGEIAGTSGKSLRLEAIEIKIVKKQKKGIVQIDTPSNGSIYYDSETSNITVVGWKMANVSNTYIKAYLDDTEVDSTTINYYERPDVLKAITNYGTATQNPIPGFNFNVDISSLDSGNHTIKINLYSDSTILATISKTINVDKSLHVQYRTHVEKEGWQNYVQDGEMAGTSGKSLRLEAMNIQLLNNIDENLNIKYQVHVQDIGWQDWKQNGEMSGTSGKSLRLEAIRICLENSEDYSIMYRVHIQDLGWQDWKTDGEMAGTSGKSLRLEAIEIKIVKKVVNSTMYIDTPTSGASYYAFEDSTINVKGWKMANVPNTYVKAYVDDIEVDSTTINYYERPDVIKAVTNYGTAEQNPTPGFNFNVDISSLDFQKTNHTIKIEVYYKDEVLVSNSTTFYLDTNPLIKYTAHVQEIGWQEYIENGAIIGTVGESLRVEALKIELVNVPSTAHIKYRSYVQGIGWTDYVQDGEQTGTTGQKRMIEAVQIEIEGLEGYIVEYQAHVQSIGWQPWASNGMESGTIEQGLRLEALKLRIVKKENTVVPQIKYSSHDATNGWTAYCKNGVVLGSTTNGIKLDALKIALENAGVANIKYQVHVQEVGWLTEVQDNAQAGTGDSVNGIEAIKVELNGLDGYSIEYRVYVIGQGWQDWVCDGEVAGTTGESLQIGAIQIKLNIKTYVNQSNSSDFSNLDESKYPGYKALLQQLQNAHPNWIITIKYTGLDWNTVLDNEDQIVNGSPKSLTQYTNQWKNGDTQYGTGWYRASRSAIAYMMDPRNSLEEAWIFQFQDLGSSAGTYSDISKMTEGTFLHTDSMINIILSTAREQGISPFHLASRIIQEQGNSGWCVNGYEYNGRTVYNYCNIGATGTTDEEIIKNGASYAYDHHWFTPETCIMGSAEFLKQNYISKGQSTLYFQKYNVVDKDNLYSHQYMQNIRAANDEGNTIYNSYRNNGLLESQFEFVIPVYENMPSSVCPRPAT